MIDKLNDNCDIGCERWSVYDYDGLSLQELLCQFFTKINECVDDVNKYSELVKKMLEWIHNEGLEEAVKDQLDKWLADGTLQKIINEKIFEDLNNKINGALNFLKAGNVLNYGAKGDGVTNDTEAFKKCIAENNNIYIPNTGKEYIIIDTLELKNDMFIKNEGIVKFTESTKNIPLFNMNQVKNIKFKGGIYRQKEALTGDYSGNMNNLFNISESQYISFEDVEMKEISGRAGIIAKKTKFIDIYRCKFYKATYSMVQMLEETEDINVIDCIFDTLTTTTIQNAYTFATGVSSFDEEYEFNCRRVTIDRCVFKNNPRWEGIDTHGCNGFTVTNCKIYNCKAGIMCGLDDRQLLRDRKHQDILIADNYIELNGQEHNGIVVQTKSVDKKGNITNLGENVIISNNIIKNAGSASNEYQSAINVNGIRNTLISGNVISGSLGYNMRFANIIDMKIVDNSINGGGKSSVSCAFAQGCYNVVIEGNILKRKDETIKYGFYSNKKSTIYIRNNMSDHNNTYSIFAIPGSEAGVKGEAVCGYPGAIYYDKQGIAKFRCKDEEIKGREETLSVRVNVRDRIATIVEDKDIMQYIAEGETIKIKGSVCKCEKYLSTRSFLVSGDICVTQDNSPVETLQSTWGDADNLRIITNGFKVGDGGQSIPLTGLAKGKELKFQYQIPEKLNINVADIISVNFTKIPTDVQVCWCLNTNKYIEFKMTTTSEKPPVSEKIEFRIVKFKI